MIGNQHATATRLTRGCSVCARTSQLADVNQDLSLRLPFRGIAAKYGLSTAAVFRHARRCLKHQPRIAATTHSDSLARFQRLYGRVEKLLNRAERKGNLRLAGELLARLDSLAAQIALAQPRPGVLRDGEQPTIRIVFANPEGRNAPHPSTTQLAYVSYALAHLGWEPVLERALRAMLEVQLSPEIQRATENLLNVLIAERERQDREGNRVAS